MLNREAPCLQRVKRPRDASAERPKAAPTKAETKNYASASTNFFFFPNTSDTQMLISYMR
jgi:hypothetical protein